MARKRTVKEYEAFEATLPPLRRRELWSAARRAIRASEAEMKEHALARDYAAGQQWKH